MDESSKPHQPVVGISSSQSTAPENSRRVVPDLSPAGGIKPQHQISSTRHNENNSAPWYERKGVQADENDSVPRLSPQKRKHAKAKNFVKRQDDDSQRKLSGQSIAKDIERKSRHIHCPLCDIYVNGAQNMPQHIKGKRHQSNLKQNRLEASNTKLDGPKKQTQRATVDAEGADRKNDDARARTADNSRTPTQHQFGLSAAVRGTQSGNERISNYSSAGGSGRASSTYPSDNVRTRDEDKRGWNARNPSYQSAGSSDRAELNIQNYEASAFRSSQHVPYQLETGSCDMDIDEPLPRRAVASNATSTLAPQYGALRSGEGNGWHVRSGEGISQGASKEATSSSFLRPAVTQQLASAHNRGDVEQMNSVETLKAIPWDPFASEYDGSKVGQQGERIPQDFLDAKMSMSEWRELRRAVMEKGDDVDKLAFKIVVETLLSPTVGIREDALDAFDSAIKKMNNVHHYSKETGSYMRADAVPEKLWRREKRFVEGDEEWMKALSKEDKALHLLCENLCYMFDPGEDAEEAGREAHFSTLPFRGVVAGMRSNAGRMIDGMSRRRGGDVSAVESDELFLDIHDFLLKQRQRESTVTYIEEDK
eukprot:TRINITY_DN63139_c0_g1_i1.p1 TRINITY_DN63139_c0_g1~~TRINITY_DN63139_c0_g1_i1.p1  ORF type:complete len:594 (-),score=107.78 TRINITY_DN63139_c0_g1_i1:473-2254(-)